MNRNIREILNKIADANAIDFNDLESQWKNGFLTDQEYLSKIRKLGFCAYLRAWANGSENNRIYNLLVHLPYLNPNAIMEELSEIEVSAKDLTLFVNWYFSEFVCFYANPNNKDKFISELNNLNLKINATILKFCNNKDENLAVLDIINYSESVKIGRENQFECYFELAQEMKQNKECGFTYSEQYEHLDFFGFNQELQGKLLYGNLMKPQENVSIQKETKEKLSKEKKPFVLTKKKKETLKKTEEEKKENERKRKLFEQLDKFYDRNTSTNKIIIEEEDLAEVFAILRELYTDSETAIMKNIILTNNKIMRQSKLEFAKETLLNEENLQYLNFISSILSGEDTRFISYVPMVEKTINGIVALLKEYISLNDEEQETLKEDYQEQIFLVLDVLKEYGLVLSECRLGR